jgi:hypothetical protein
MPPKKSASSPTSRGASSKIPPDDDPTEYDKSSYYQTKGTCVSEAMSIRTGYTIGSESLSSSQVSNDGSVFPPASCVTPYVPRDEAHSIFMNVKFKDVIAAYPHRDLLFLASVKGRDNKEAIKLGLLCSTPINKRNFDTPEQSSLWSMTRHKLLTFYNEVFKQEYDTVKDLIFEEGDLERRPHNITNHFILYSGPAANPTIIAAVSYGCDYDVHQRDEWGFPLPTKVFIHYIATKQGNFLKQVDKNGDDKPFQKRGIGAFMLGFVDNYLRIDKPFIPFYLLVNMKAGLPRFFDKHGYHKAVPRVANEIKPMFFSIRYCTTENKKKAQHLLESHVPAWLCGPPKLSNLALSPPSSVWEDYESMDNDVEDDERTIQTMATCLDE